MLAPLTRGPGVCPPVNPCCCDNWSISPGDCLPLQISFLDALFDAQGFHINRVDEVSLVSLNEGPPGTVADPDEMAIVSGYEVDPPHAQPGFAEIIQPGEILQFMICCGKDTQIGRGYRLDVCAVIRDCTGKAGRICHCVFISVQAC